ncbi:MAG: Asp-tRNA(Asn)/Glu-tRNA(Gln) amidotransferase subunit GatB [Candidatus Saccharibacteria bacterium]|uniref:Aspartyl/glutamyl-tRNA(Asn/Gln) amidotransferase subunit B n=1 Tax=Candidatus Nanosyncoccus alces TaxID=2171997 RepID=A0ABY0FMW9_9BACT|nr:Asp-tRNA(Asn)/Glu-tRNA(Gln) amidotransferase subunit GatB [Candidatus Nanosyncoccus alces]MDO4398867.1 Asp-tRNA(Asn)/Glu-tRNA(Gln) amidotransferase subunit GatB [Candidatus Saccharibacteria bacterium]RYC74543.1 Aspartyl/glutamyl-tRNA(Asn/Gln) amidotransferase subunit B [Candidatus Nanosyncoccus alces]
MKYIPTIGIECHVQLATKTKLFSEVDNDARNKEPNSCVSPVDYALPGMLPRLNGEAIKFAILAGKAMNCEINASSRFDRKHYFYPDSPKGYQITQFYHPIIGAGYVELPSGTKIRIEHAHLEGDAGKLTHFDTYSLVDLNRVDTPLIEIVSMPDIHSAKDAHDYCKELWRLMTFAGVSYGDLYNGNMRFDVNVSLAPEGSTELGTRAEIKNLNSFRSVERAAEYEIVRQSKLLDAGEKIIQETRGWSDDTGKTTGQRSKEEAKDYRYMPEPDLPPVNLSADFIQEVAEKLPLMPADYRRKFGDSLKTEILEILLDYPELIRKLSEVDEKYVVTVSNLFTSVLLAEEKSAEYLNDLPTAKQLNDLAKMNEKKELSSTATKEVFLHLFDPQMRRRDTEVIAKELGLIQENDLGALETIVDAVLAKPETQEAQADFRAGEEKVIGFLVGQVMKESHGKANPSAVQEILRKKLA